MSFGSLGLDKASFALLELDDRIIIYKYQVGKLGGLQKICRVPNCPKTGVRCLKIIEKVAFTIASETSYIFILSRLKFSKKAKNSQF